MTRYLQDVEIELDEYASKTVPGLIIYDAWLHIDVDRSCSREGEWYISSLYMEDTEKRQYVTFKKGDWLFDTIVKEIENDYGWQDIITRKCADED